MEREHDPREHDVGTRRTRKRSIRGIIAAAIGFLFSAVLTAGAGAFAAAYLLYLPPSAAYSTDTGEPEPRPFEVKPGEGLRTVSGHLKSTGLARSAIAVEFYGRIAGFAGRLKAGRYLISPGMSPAEILEVIAEGRSLSDDATVTIKEGWNVGRIGEELESVGLFPARRFVDAAVVPPETDDFPFLSGLPVGDSLEGYLFPDTYRFARDAEPEDAVRAMLENFSRRVIETTPSVTASWERTLREILILASIVQAEAGGVEEMRDIAGVFAKRLTRGIPLESDATVNYALGTSKRRPTYADIRTDHPYNTYRRRGLPPGPIGNPGLDAIRSAADPADNPYFFFLHKENREVVFSRTFDEHLERKARYLD